MTTSNSWFFWAALVQAVFAALTAIFLPRSAFRGVDSDLATLVRTAIIMVVLSAFVRGQWSNPSRCHPEPGCLGLFGLATGGRPGFPYYFGAAAGRGLQVAPVISSAWCWWPPMCF
jgi:transporter family protein